MGDRLRAVWDFDDLDATEKRFRTMLSVETDPAGRASVLTQLARIDGLRGDTSAGEALLDAAAVSCGADLAAEARIHLERGRLRRATGQDSAAMPLFEAAFQSALAGGEEVLAVDAAHMAAVVAEDRTARIEWIRRGTELAQRSTIRVVGEWLAPLLTALGWEYFNSDDLEPALDAFERALQLREREPERPAEIELARYAVARTLLRAGQPEEAAELLEQAVAWADAAGTPDGWYCEELATAYAALGRPGDARAQAERALELLPGADPSFASDGERARALRGLTH